MRCNICNNLLSEKEIVFNTDIKAFEPCSTCLEVALDAAFSGGFSSDTDPLDDSDIEDQFGDGVVETLDLEAGTVFLSGFETDTWQDTGDRIDVV
jgi:hypothetical protein